MRNRNRQRGTQIAELAICLPLLCFIVLAVIDGADVVRAHIVLNNAAREGARLSSSVALSCPNNTCSTVSTVQQYVYDYVGQETGGLGLGGATAHTASCSSPLALSNIVVTQNVPYQFNDPSSGNTINSTASRVTITFPYNFCYVSNAASFFGGMANAVTLQTAATFRNLPN